MGWFLRLIFYHVLVLLHLCTNDAACSARQAVSHKGRLVNDASAMGELDFFLFFRAFTGERYPPPPPPRARTFALYCLILDRGVLVLTSKVYRSTTLKGCGGKGKWKGGSAANKYVGYFEARRLFTGRILIIRQNVHVFFVFYRVFGFLY